MNMGNVITVCENFICPCCGEDEKVYVEGINESDILISCGECDRMFKVTYKVEEMKLKHCARKEIKGEEMDI